MKVYELMAELAKMPSGSRVFVSMVKPLSELPKDENGSRIIYFEVDFVNAESNAEISDTVLLDALD
jgi:hypothetical protein